MVAKAAAARVSPAALMVRGALLAYLQPRLAMDQRPNTMKIVNRATQGVTSRNYRQLAPQVANALRRSVQGRLAQDGGIDDLAALLSALAPEAQQADQAPGLGQIASNPGGSAGPMGTTPPQAPDQGGGESSDIIAKIKAYLEQEGVAPEILNNLDAFLAEHQPAAPTPPPGAPPAAPGGPGGPGGPGDAGGGGGIVGLGGGSQGGMSTGGMGSGGGLDVVGGAPAPTLPGLDQEGTEGLVEGGNNGGSWRDLDPRGGTENDLKPESAEDETMDNNLPEAFRDDDEADDEEAEDELVPGEQDEQLDGVPKVSSSGTKSRYVGGGGGGEDRAITKSAMDKAIRIAQDAAIKTQRDIRQAERFVRPWVGDMAMDEARGPADVYRAALKALGVKGADKVHPDALRPILEAQPTPSMRTMRDQQVRMATDSAPGGKASGSFLERFPDAAKITIQ